MSRLDSSYARSPIWMQNAMVTLQGARFRLGRTNDAVIKAELARLLASEKLDHEQRRERLTRELGRFLKTAILTTPHYSRQHAVGEIPEIWNEPDPIALMSELPLLEKRHVRGREGEFFSHSVSSQRVTWGHTSGTTGSPIRTKETVVSMSRRFAFIARLRIWAGLKDAVHPRRAQFTGRMIAQDSPPFWRSNSVDNALLFSTVNISEASVSLYADALRSQRPVLMDGYPSAMLAIARLAQARHEPLPRIPAIITTAETLTDSARSEISEAFGGRVFNQYSMTEPGCFWSDCQYGRLHIHEEFGVSEILDSQGRPSKPGAIGEVVVTSVLNPAMPLIRYRTGDLARVGVDRHCSCGRDLPIVDEVLGRMDDTLFIPDRGYLGRLDPVYKGLVGIVESQIVQDSLAGLRVLVVTDYRFDEIQRERLVANIRARVGPGIEIVVEAVPSIPRGANGKFRSVVSHCRDQYPAGVRL